MQKSQIAIDTLWLFLAYGIRLGLQAFSFVLIAKILGLSEFGSFSAFFSLCLLFAPFIELGCYFLIVRDVNLGVTVCDAVGLALKPLIIMSFVSFFCIVIICYIFLPALNKYSILPIGLAILFFARITALVNGVNASQNEIWKNAVIEIVGGMALISLVYLTELIHLDKEIVYWAIFGQYFFSSIFAIWNALRVHGLPNFRYGSLGKRFKEGLSFAVGIFSYGANNEADKTLLARFTSLDIVGSYGLVTRIIVMSYVPLNAFLNSVFPRLATLYTVNIKRFYNLSQITFRVTSAYGLFVSMVFYFFSSFLVVIFGNDYTGIDIILKLASGIVALQALQFPLADFLNISGFLQVRAGIQTCTFIFSVALNIYFIPIFSWLGSLLALYISTTICLLLLISMAFYVRKRRAI